MQSESTTFFKIIFTGFSSNPKILEFSKSSCAFNKNTIFIPKFFLLRKIVFQFVKLSALENVELESVRIFFVKISSKQKFCLLHNLCWKMFQIFLIKYEGCITVPKYSVVTRGSHRHSCVAQTHKNAHTHTHTRVNIHKPNCRG